MNGFRDEFLSEEDLDLKSLTHEELDLAWMNWLEQAQVTNEADQREYAHGVFLREPPWPAARDAGEITLLVQPLRGNSADAGKVRVQNDLLSAYGDDRRGRIAQV